MQHKSDINHNFKKTLLYDFHLEISFDGSKLAATLDSDEEPLIKFSGESEGVLKQEQLSALIQ